MIRRRASLVVFAVSTLWSAERLAHAQVQLPNLPPPPPQATAPEEEPPEEDDALKPKVYEFNPVQARREITAGNFYFKKGNLTAAASRYKEATRWDSGSTEAWQKLGETNEKRKDFEGARAAYEKFLEVSTNVKDNEVILKRLDKLPAPKGAKR